MLMKLILPPYTPANISAGLGLQLCDLQTLRSCARVLVTAAGLGCMWTLVNLRLVFSVMGVQLPFENQQVCDESPRGEKSNPLKP